MQPQQARNLPAPGCFHPPIEVQILQDCQSFIYFYYSSAIQCDHPYIIIQFDMEGVVDQLASLLQLTSLDEMKQLQFVHRKMGIKPSALVIATLVFLVIVTFISNATSLVVGIGCCVAPAYFTFLVLESGQKNSLKKYLIYWIVYSVMELISPALTLLLPSVAYILVRIGIAVALLHPESPAAEKLFQGGIKPLLAKHEGEIDQNIKNALEKGKEGLKKGANYIGQYAKK